MPAVHGVRARTRDLFARPFRKKGYAPLSTYLRTYKIGQYVDIKVNGSIHKGMPHKFYHGRTSVVWNVTKWAIGVEMNKEVAMEGTGSSNGKVFGDTTNTKVFVGGLAWETKREAMHLYFEQFGEILEAVVITDKNTGRSRGYGFIPPRSSMEDELIATWLRSALGIPNLVHHDQVRNKIIKKRIHVRIEHVQPSRCVEDAILRRKNNDQLKVEAKACGEIISTKRQPEGPKPGFIVEGAVLETVTPIPYDVVNDLKGGY